MTDEMNEMTETNTVPDEVSRSVMNTWVMPRLSRLFPNLARPYLTGSGQFTRADWDAYDWNPQNIPNSADKLTWEELLGHIAPAYWDENRPLLLDLAYRQCQKNICRIYQGKDVSDEIYKRKFAENHDDPDIKTSILTKDRAKKFYELRYHQFKNWIENKTDLAGLYDENYNPIGGAMTGLWSAEWTPVDGATLTLPVSEEMRYNSAPTVHNINSELERRKQDYNGNLAEQVNKLLACVVDCGTDRATWAESDRDRFANLKAKQNDLETLNLRAEELKEMTPIPDDYHQEKYWQDTAYVASDTSPDPFIFELQSRISLGATATSNTITVEGINAATPISVRNGTLLVDGVAFTGQTIVAGQTVAVQVTASQIYGKITIATVTIGDFTAEFNIQTISYDDPSLPHNRVQYY